MSEEFDSDAWLEGWDAEGDEDTGDGWTYDGDKVPAYDPGLDPTNW